MSDYVEMEVRISEEDIREHLSNYLTEEEIENTDLQSEATEVVDSILQEYFSDFTVTDNNSIVYNSDDFEPLGCHGLADWERKTMKIESNFNFDDNVEISPLNCEGRIVSFWLKSTNSLMIEVRYYINNEIKTEYFYEDELKPVKNLKVGFINGEV